MEGDDFSCDKFQPQKWRKDMCRNCYQPLRVHDKTPEITSPLPSPGKEAKVFQRFRVNRDQEIDRSIPAKERTQQAQNLEGITAGKVAGALGASSSGQGKSPSPTPSLPKPQPPATISSVGPPSNRSSPTPTPVAAPQSQVTKATAPASMGTHFPRTTSGSKLPSRPPPPATAIHKPPPPATIGTIKEPQPTSTHSQHTSRTSPQPPSKETTCQPAQTDNIESEDVQERISGVERDEVLTEEQQLQPAHTIEGGTVAEVSSTSQTQVMAEVGEMKTEQDVEKSADFLKNPDTMSQTGTGNEELAKVEEVMEVVEMTAAPALESALSFDFLLTEGDVQTTTQEDDTPATHHEPEEAVITSPPDTSQAVVTEVAVVQLQAEEMVEHSLQGDTSMPSQPTNDPVHTVPCDTSQELETGEVEDQGEEAEDGEGEEGGAEEDIDGPGQEETDSGLKSLKKRLSLKRKPKKKPSVSEEASEPSPAPQQGEDGMLIGLPT